MFSPKARSFAWAALESGGLSLLSLVALLVVARLVGPAEVGMFALALGTVQILTTIVEMLIHDAIVQRRDLTDVHLQSAFWTTLFLGAGFTALCFVLAPRFASYLEKPELEAIFAASALSIMASGLGAVPVAVMRREMRFKPLALRSLYGRLAGVLIAFVTIWMGWGIWSLVAQHLAQICLATILVWQASTWRPRFVFSSRRLAELLRFGVFSVGSRFLWVSSSRLFVLFVGNLAGLAAAGFVSVAFRLVDTLFDLLASAADNFALPLFSRLQHDPRALFRAYCTATELTTLVTLPLFVGLSIGTDPIVRVLLGEDWLAAVPLVQWLALSAGLQFFLLFTHTALNAVGRPGVIFVATAASLGFVAVTALLAQPTEALSATIIWALRILVGGPILIVVLLRVLGAAPDVLLATIWRPVAVTAPMAVFVFFLNKAVWPSQDAMLQLAILIAAGAMTYGVSLALYARPALRRMLSFVVGTRPAPDSSAGAIRNETATT